MLNEEQVSRYLDALVNLGAIERVPSAVGGPELFRLRVRDDRILGSILAGGLDEPPEGTDVVPWSACTIVKTLLEESQTSVSREEFAGISAVFMGFLSEGVVMRGQSGKRTGQAIAASRSNRKRAGAGQ